MKLIGFVFEYNPIPDSTRIKESLPSKQLTDGIWVWPSYLSYYLNKGFHNLLNVDFLHHVRTRYYEMDDCLEVKQNMNVYKN